MSVSRKQDIPPKDPPTMQDKEEIDPKLQQDMDDDLYDDDDYDFVEEIELG